MLFPRSWQLGLVGFLGALALAGCGGGGGHAPGAGGDGNAILSWSIYDIEDTGYTVPLRCADVGATTVVVTLTGAAGIFTQAPANCSDGQMQTANVPGGAYTVGFDLYGDTTIYRDPNLTLLDSFDVTGTFNILGGTNDFRAQFAPLIVQRFDVAWAFNSGTAANICALAGGSFVDFDFALPTSASWITSPFSCATGGGMSYPIPLVTDSAGNLVANPTWTWMLYLVNSSSVDLQTITGGNVTPGNSTDPIIPTQYFTY